MDVTAGEIAAGAAPGAGLTSREAQARLQRYGPNAAPRTPPHPLQSFLGKLWGPVPWMLELALALQLVLAKHVDAIVIGALLLLNAALAFVQERRAERALDSVRDRITSFARVQRDGRWQLRPAAELVPGDRVRLRAGDLVPADVRALDGQVAIDQSALTGESIPVEVESPGTVPAGTVVTRGEVTGEVAATGVRTIFGRTVELVQTTKTASHLEQLILKIVRYLIALDAVLVAAVIAYAPLAGLPFAEVLPFALILLVASVPISLPATFTLAEAVGALDLAGDGVLVTRLSAIEEAAAMDVLCSDKTGTITKNELRVAMVHAEAPAAADDVLRLAAFTCDEATQDPIDLAILRAVRERGVAVDPGARRRFVPFDPSTKRSEAVVAAGGGDVRVLKGTPAVLATLCVPGHDLDPEVERMAEGGCRVVAVAAGPHDRIVPVGLIGLADPPRDDSPTVIRRLQALGIRVLMLTGDTVATARAVGAAVGLGNRACPSTVLEEAGGAHVLDCDVFAGIYPEEKLRLVAALQRTGHTVGMTGDGVNDAPALKQAEVGIAVANATDVAKAAAGIVLTNPGLGDALTAVEIGRRIYQRMLTYTLNKIVKTLTIGMSLSLGLLTTGIFVTTPHLVVLLLFTNDFVTMSLATDRVAASARPEHWRVEALVAAALVLAVGWLSFGIAAFVVARRYLGLDVPQLQTLTFLFLVFGGQATIYLVRERRRCWASAPGRWVVTTSIADVVVVSALAGWGILMRPLPAWLIGAMLLAVVLYAIPLDIVKTRLFRRLGMR